MSFRPAVAASMLALIVATQADASQTTMPASARSSNPAADMVQSQVDPLRATRPATPADEQLVKAIQQSMGSQPLLANEVKNITVIASEGAIVLRGLVANELAKARADEIVRNVQGVKEVTNELDVKPRVMAPTR
ncbi:MAG TPA: BON domain-containing protein [Dyella sp.]|uniref:BON domain-containing protein n=1 Tax=Dyella sp. TaxID=1869338 RepID=UPI002D774B2A|nr:BON domain-containing protein [Dyella sp.]HET6555277.1 BON domain-containing protein [Dyella sp.]